MLSRIKSLTRKRMCLFLSAAAAIIILVALIIFFFVLRSPTVSITKLSHDSSKKLEMRKGGAIVPWMLELEVNNANYFALSFPSLSVVVSPAGMRDRKGKYSSNNVTVDKLSLSKVMLPVKIPLSVEVIKSSCIGSKKKQLKMNVTVAFDFKTASNTGSQNFTTPMTVECPAPLQNPRLVEVLTTGKLPSPTSNQQKSKARSSTIRKSTTTTTRARTTPKPTSTRVATTRATSIASLRNNRSTQMLANTSPSSSHRPIVGTARPLSGATTPTTSRIPQRRLNSLPIAGHSVRKLRF